MNKPYLLGLGVIILLGGIYYVVNQAPTITAPTPENSPVADVQVSEAPKVKGELVKYFGNVEGYLALPETAGPHPGIILIHEWWGKTEDMHQMAEKFAHAGYVALAVDLYNGENTADQAKARELSAKVRGDIDTAFNNLEAAVAFLDKRSEVEKGNLASVGWCFGGGWSYQMAANELGVKASIMYYGQFDPEDDFEHMKAHILGHFGEKDTAIKIDSVKEFQAAVQTAKGKHEVYIYPNVGHGFANQRGGTNIAYNEEAASLAWNRTMDFLDKVLGK